MNDLLPHPVIIFTYVCDTCGLEVGPYNYGHKNIECENCGDGLLSPVRGKGFMTTEEWENIEPTVFAWGGPWARESVIASANVKDARAARVHLFSPERFAPNAKGQAS